MPYWGAAAVGAALWIATTWLTGRREAWDAGAYWTYAYPAAIALAAAIGAVARAASPWKIGLSMMFAQALTMVVSARSPTLLPLGLILFAVLSVPVSVGAIVGRALGRRRA